MRRGWTFLIPSGPNKKNHLFFVLNHPDDNTDAVLASLSSMHRRADRTCVLRPGDHPFIRHESYIDYRHCRTDCLIHSSKMLESGYWIRCEKAADQLVERIVDGARRSEHTRPRVLKLLS